MGYSREESKRRREKIKELLIKDPSLTNQVIQDRVGCCAGVVYNVRKELRLEHPDYDLLTKKDMRRAKTQFPFSQLLPGYVKKKRRKKK